MIPEAVPDATLLREYARAGADDAFRQLVERHTPLVFGTCQRILGDADQAQDAAQATFVALALKAARIDAGHGLGGWLHRVARQVSLDMQKAARRRAAREQEAWRRVDMEGQPSGRPGGGSVPGLDDAIDQLPAKLRAAVIQHYFEGVSLEEIALRQGCTPSAISMRLTRARATLRRSFERGDLVAFPVLGGGMPAGTTGAFTHAAVRTAAAALQGRAAVEPTAAWAVEVARRALGRLLFWRLRWGLAGGAVVAVGLAVLPLVHSQAVPPAATLAAAAPAVAPAAPVQQAARSTVATIAPVSPAHGAADPRLIAALKQPLSFEALPAFKSLLDGTPSPLDAVRDAGGRTALHWAARGGDEEPALLLLLRGASPNAPDAAGRTPLFDAIERDDKWMTLLFVLAKADVNHHADDGSSPLSLAVRKGSLPLSEWLLWLGASPHADGTADIAQPDALARTNGDPAMARLFDDYDALRRRTFSQQPRAVPVFIKDGLQEAARRGDLMRLDKLLSSKLDINTPDDNGRTALHQAISAAQPDVVFYLLLLGANPNVQDNQGRSPLMTTMGWLGGGLDAMRRFLIVKGASPFTVRHDGHTELSWSAVRTNEHGMQWLLWLGANGHEINPKYGTATQIAYDEGAQRVLDLLRRNGINEQPKRHDDPVWNLNNAALRGDLALVQKLLAAGLSPDAPDAKGNSPLMNAVYGRNVAVARCLVEAGADINFRNPKDGTTPLISTLCWDFSDLTQFRADLLKAGADPNVCGDDGVTPAMRACGHVPGVTLRQLVQAGADLGRRDGKGQTILTRAIQAGDLDTAEFLRQQGAAE